MNTAQYGPTKAECNSRQRKRHRHERVLYMTLTTGSVLPEVALKCSGLACAGCSNDAAWVAMLRDTGATTTGFDAFCRRFGGLEIKVGLGMQGRFRVARLFCNALRRVDSTGGLAERRGTNMIAGWRCSVCNESRASHTPANECFQICDEQLVTRVCNVVCCGDDS